MTPERLAAIRAVCGPMFSAAKARELERIFTGALSIAHPIPPADYKAAQEEINRRNGLGDADALATLRALVQQIAISDYRDKLGHPLKNNVAYRDAVALLALTTSTKPSASE
jgi:hypothetical protein